MSDHECLAEAFLEQSPACVWIVGEDLAFHRVYGSPAPILGKPAEELTGRCALDALDAELAATWADRFNRALAGEILHLRERSGDATWQISVFPIRKPDGTIYAGALAREMTPWNTAEQELRNTVLGALKAKEFERNTLSRFLH